MFDKENKDELKSRAQPKINYFLKNLGTNHELGDCGYGISINGLEQIFIQFFSFSGTRIRKLRLEYHHCIQSKDNPYFNILYLAILASTLAEIERWNPMKISSLEGKIMLLMDGANNPTIQHRIDENGHLKLQLYFGQVFPNFDDVLGKIARYITEVDSILQQQLNSLKL